MSDTEQIQQIVQSYITAIHTQDKDSFLSLWTGNKADTLISLTSVFHGDEAIYQDFLIDKIQACYSYIELFADHIDIHQIDEENAIVIFSYHTVCRLRETGEDYGIEGIETQVFRKVSGQWKLLHIYYSK